MSTPLPTVMTSSIASHASHASTIQQVAEEKNIRNILRHHIIPQYGIGAGCFGEVCLALETQRHQLVAVKTLRTEGKLSKQVEQELISEAEKMACIRDENILDFYGICVDTSVEPPIYCLILPYMENGSVSGLLRDIAEINSKLPVASAVSVPWCIKLRMLYQAASGMTALHSHNIIHIDLKASNVLLNEDLHVKITDFGLSRWHNASGFQSRTASNLKGTPSHIPPEYLENSNKTPTKEFDAYSYGIFMWEVLTGKTAYDNCVHRTQMLISVISGTRPDLKHLPSDVPQAYSCVNNTVVPLMKQCWDGKPKTRKTMAEAKDVLEPLFTRDKRKAQEEVPKLLKHLSKHKEAVNQLTVDYGKLTLQEYVSQTQRHHVESSQADVPNAFIPESHLPVQVQSEKLEDAVNEHGQPRNIPMGMVGQTQQRHYHAHPESAAINNMEAVQDLSHDGPKFSNIGSAQGSNGQTVQHIHTKGPVHVGRSTNYHNTNITNTTSEEPELIINKNPDLKANNIDLNDREGEVSDHHIKRIVHDLGKKYWRKLGRDCLLFKDGELDAIEVDFRDSGLLEQITQMFRQWKEKHGHKATRKWLATGLLYLNRKDLVEILNNK